MATSPLARRLTAPAGCVALAELPGLWFHAEVVARCRGGAELAADPDSLARLRGAWGQALLETASPEAKAGRPCPWSPPCALDVFFGVQGRFAGGLEIPKPYVLALEAAGNDLIARLTLAGFASDWAEAAAEALVRGLARGVHGRAGEPGLQVVERSVTAYDALPLPPPGREAALRFVTPLSLRRQSGGLIERGAGDLVPALVKSLTERVIGLARWQDLSLELDRVALAAAARSLEIVENDLRRAAPGQRRSGRQGDRPIPVEGLLGTIIVAGDLAPVLPLLAIGRAFHAGSHAALGQGRFTLLVAP